MSRFVANSTDFAADCAHQRGRCTVARQNVLFLDDGNELAAVDQLQRRCGHVVIMPHATQSGHSVLYHTSCERMADVVGQIFGARLGAPTSLPLPSAEMSLGVLHRRFVAIPYVECRSMVAQFSFEETPAPAAGQPASGDPSARR